MQLVWITFNISNEVIGFASDKTRIITKNYANKRELYTFPQELKIVEN